MASHLIADEGTSLWGHIFPDDPKERMTRFVYDLDAQLLLAVQIQTGPVTGWRDATAEELLDVAADLDTNRPYASPGDWDLGVAEDVPEWATDLVAAARASFSEICENAARDEALVPEERLTYEQWLDWSGLDDSFVGDLQRGIPGTRDKFDASERLPAPGASPRP